VDNLSTYDRNTYTADEVLQNVYRMNAMVENGISADEAGQILSMEIDHETESLGKDQMQNYWYTYIMIFALYISVIILIASTCGVGVLAAKIYRVGVLLYGTTPKIGTILKSVWKA
jgi:ABC-2 type transport system permease protein